MEIKAFEARDLDTVLRVLRTALSRDAPLSPTQRAFVDTYAEIAGVPVPSTDPGPIAAQEVKIASAHARKRLIQLAGMAALLNRPVTAASAQFLRALSEGLATRDPVVRVVECLAQGRTMRARLITVRRSFRAILKEAYLAEGALGVGRFLFAIFFRKRVNKDQVWRYKRLGLLPEGTLGREYWKHLTELGFGFPGEPAGIPDSVAYHDIGHVLADNDTTPLGEIQQGSFQGGNRREDGFFFIQFVILQFHHGIKITPVAPGEVGNFDPAKVLWAIHRGASCTVDITHQWNFWDLMPLPLEEARKQCGLLPKLA